MNPVTEPQLLAITGGNFAHDAGYAIGATLSWMAAIGGAQSGNPGFLAEKVAEMIYA